ncbi:MAG: PSP1 domain-containing protein, partial [Candidatus Marinimicrobia bacterium]|nr:PSP1 domain-containing protein [Candidatus Neomarinimicrobiota bacterium]
MSDNDKLVKIKFQGCRREIFRNKMGFPIENDDTLIVDAERGEDIGIAVSYPEPKSASETDNDKLTVLRKANSYDLEKNNENKLHQKIAHEFCQLRIDELQLPMKLIDVEYRLDRKKIIFFFTADDRIDFRE